MGNRNLQERIPGTNLFVMQTPVSLDVDIVTISGRKGR